MNELNENELTLLRQVQQERVGFSRRRYFLMDAGQPDVSLPVQLLRARGLVRLRRVEPGRRIPPTQMCEPTAAGLAVLQAVADASV